jgi:glutamate synthase domain-containing protein 1
LPFSTFNNFMTDKKWFDALKKEIQKNYDDLCSEKYSLNENLQKLTEHIEKQMQNFWKIEFYVGTKNRDIGFVKDIVTVNDPKNFYKIDQKLWWSDKETFDKQWKVKIFEKKRRINDLW